ncbi:Glucan 1,3-beta-glucosidase 3 [Apophysomyces ossiformis]|uniref:Glucan 1,3-beta-glucosidase 3 n=1 Tax=Apophysomyces ossiformis TaxID=679940 RepID=A0A8H7BS28_9FUNG|nr:Glucan 1,3-beta-glucosidase 3 [Apophysomyces ossiformis]
MAGFVKDIVGRIKPREKPTALTLSAHIPHAPEFPPFNAEITELFRYRRQAGVNIGSLFVLEKWLCPPRLCSSALSTHWDSELDFLTQCESLEHARQSLEDHWDNFITNDDFKFLASTGINSVRLPIGYWIAGREFLAPPFDRFAGIHDAAWNRFLNIIAMAAKHGIGVLVDLHAAPGAKVQFLKSANQSVTIKVLRKLASTLAPINNVIGLEILNEPSDSASLTNFYLKAIRAIRDAVPDIDLPIYIHDAWNMAKYSSIIQPIQRQYGFVVLDTHQYFCHQLEDHKKSAEQHIAHVSSTVKESIERNGRLIRNNIIVGEWSVVLNSMSMPRGADEAQVMREFGRVELDTWDAVCPGHFYWTYKTSDDNWYWSYIYCHRKGILPGKFRNGSIPERIVQKILALVRTGPHRNQEHHQAQTSHIEYWTSRGQQEVKRHIVQFDEGFKDGYEVALRFLEEAASRVGFIEQLAIGYALRNQTIKTQKKEFAWQFNHGFMQGVAAIDKAILEEIGQSSHSET